MSRIRTLAVAAALVAGVSVVSACADSAPDATAPAFDAVQSDSTRLKAPGGTTTIQSTIDGDCESQGSVTRC